MTPLLEARGITVEGRLRPTDLTVSAGELVAIIGPNGGGKTSLLRALAGIERDAGSVSIASEDLDKVSPARRPHLTTFLPATREVVWPISASDVIALGLPSPDTDRVKELLILLELQPLAARPVDRLSTGERTRVLLARALAPGPKALLLDEPLSNLDPYWVLSILQVLRTVVGSGCSTLVALHDIDRVAAFDRVLLVDGGQIVEDLPPEQMLSSAILADAFRIEREGSAWRIRTPADPLSSR